MSTGQCYDSAEHRPLSVRIVVHAGTFHNFTVPDQLPVARILLLGAKRTCDIGRSSPICEPILLKRYRQQLVLKYRQFRCHLP
jgi:hypothetical protein